VGKTLPCECEPAGLSEGCECVPFVLGCSWTYLDIIPCMDEFLWQCIIIIMGVLCLTFITVMGSVL